MHRDGLQWAAAFSCPYRPAIRGIVVHCTQTCYTLYSRCWQCIQKLHAMYSSQNASHCCFALFSYRHTFGLLTYRQYIGPIVGVMPCGIYRPWYRWWYHQTITCKWEPAKDKVLLRCCCRQLWFGRYDFQTHGRWWKLSNKSNFTKCHFFKTCKQYHLKPSHQQEDSLVQHNDDVLHLLHVLANPVPEHKKLKQLLPLLLHICKQVAYRWNQQ